MQLPARVAHARRLLVQAKVAWAVWKTESPDRPIARIIRSLRSPKALKNPSRQRANLSSHLNLIWPVQIESEKYLSLRKSEIMRIVPPSRSDKRGGRVVTNAGRDAMDVKAPTDERRLFADGEDVWSWHPLAGAKFADRCFASRGRR
ncbi:MAG: hypothetical protein ACRECL_15040 [Bradyrhizobium sp.]